MSNDMPGLAMAVLRIFTNPWIIPLFNSHFHLQDRKNPSDKNWIDFQNLFELYYLFRPGAAALFILKSFSSSSNSSSYSSIS